MKRGSKGPILLSALVCPGAGQMVQGRWLIGLTFLLLFLIPFTLVCIEVLGPLFYNVRIALDYAAQGGNEPFQAPHLARIFFLFGLALMIHGINIIDVVRANRRM